ncbi:MAG: DNA repair protein RecN [Planctomycetota bacterium]|nr:DNA repair protein RecN [Planctomycetota bacterium]
MLRLLRVRNFALIDQLELEFEPGFNLLSGETGAGKSLVVDALALLAGGKATTDVIRRGENKAIIEAVFEASARIDLEPIGIDAEDGELVLRREIAADNRNRVYINSQPSTVAALRALAPDLLDIHGQHEQQTLLRTSTQLALIDRVAEAAVLRDRVRTLYEAIGTLEDELAKLETAESEVLQRTDLLRFQRGEIERTNPLAEETDHLREQVEILEHSGRLLETATASYQSLYEAEASVLSLLAAVERSLHDAEVHDSRLTGIAEQSATARALVEDMAYSLRDYLQKIDVDPGGLEHLQTRLSELERLHRKYGPDLGAHLEKVIQELDNIGLTETKKAEIAERLASLRKDFRDAAEQLSGSRRTCSADLEKSVTSEVRSLAMPAAEFSIGWTTVDPPRATGLDLPRLMLAPNPGEDPALLAQVASGGELSRVMLALRTVMADDGGGKSLVFDEIDAGIGGEAAETVGRKLKELSGSYQVFSVTHLAQIARFADHHYRIEKLVVDQRTVTRIEALAGEARIEELARMMSGPKVSEAARKHVKELLKRQ